MTDPRLRDYLEHIVAAIERIQTYARGLEASAFLADTLVQDAVIRNLEIIGEASGRIRIRAPEFAAEHPELPLSAAYEMRNRISHGYFEIDLEIVWKTVVQDLPELAAAVRRLLAEQE